MPEFAKSLQQEMLHSSSSPVPSSHEPRGQRFGGAQRGDRPVPSWHQSQQLLQPSHAVFPSHPNYFHVFLLCSFCRTAFPCQDPVPVIIPRLGQCCTEVSLRSPRAQPQLPAPSQDQATWDLLRQHPHSAREKEAGQQAGTETQAG